MLCRRVLQKKKRAYSLSKVILALAVSFFSYHAVAQGSGTKQNTDQKEPKVQTNSKNEISDLDKIRCEKMMGNTLAEFKAALVENCDLKMPFSSSVSRMLNEETYLYCCHVRSNPTL